MGGEYLLRAWFGRSSPNEPARHGVGRSSNQLAPEATALIRTLLNKVSHSRLQESERDE